MNFSRNLSLHFELIDQIFNFIDMDSNILSRITINPTVCHGKPTIRNTRYMVESILEYLAGGDTIESLTKTFPDLIEADVLACIAYANEVMKMKGATPKAA